LRDETGQCPTKEGLLTEKARGHPTLSHFPRPVPQTPNPSLHKHPANIQRTSPDPVGDRNIPATSIGSNITRADYLGVVLHTQTLTGIVAASGEPPLSIICGCAATSTSPWWCGSEAVHSFLLSELTRNPPVMVNLLGDPVSKTAKT